MRNYRQSKDAKKPANPSRRPPGPDEPKSRSQPRPYVIGGSGARNLGLGCTKAACIFCSPAFESYRPCWSGFTQIYPGAGHGITEEEVRFVRNFLDSNRRTSGA